MSEVLTIGTVASRSSVATPALRFYEDRGLIRSARTQPVTEPTQRSVIRPIAFIVFAQRVGLTDRCKLANPDDRAAAQGSGPRYLLG